VGEEIDFDLVTVDRRLHSGTFGGVVVSARDQDLTID
jgi:hypothetical protein